MIPGESVYLKVRLSVSDPGSARLLGFSAFKFGSIVEGQEEGDGDLAILRILVQYPDLVFDGPIITVSEDGGPFSAGKEIVISFSILDQGACPSGPFCVRLTADNRTLEEVQVQGLAPSSPERFTVTAELPAGKHNLNLEIDPGNEVIETQDQFMVSGKEGNIVSCEISVAEDGKEERSGFLSFGVGALIGVVLGSLALLMIFVIWRSGRGYRDHSLEE
jgi:hypothetical protein